MATQTIQYQNKVALNTNPDIADINKVTDNDMNEIKAVVNNNANETSNNTTSITNLNTYSTNEKQIGTWIDGKPIYRKVYQLTTPSTENSWQAMGTTGVNIDTIVDFRGTILETGQRKYNSINFGEGSYYVHTAINAGNDRGINMIQKGWSSLPCVITIEYTKATD